MSLDKRYSPLFTKYLEQYQNNPQSRVFAALAEIYRQLGMLDKAIDLLKEGINKHPHYPLGYLGLALCYQEREEYGLVYSTLRPIVNGNRDNIKLQKVFANACQQLENYDEALESYKYLLFINPKDREVAARLDLLKDKERVLKNIPAQAPDIHPPALFNLVELEISSDDGVSDNWVQLDLHQVPSGTGNSSRPQIITSNRQQFEEDLSEETDDNWKIGDLGAITETIVMLNPSDQKKTKDLPLAIQVDDRPEDLMENLVPQDGGPVITLTLVDLYISQKHFSKAASALQQLLASNPQDQKIKNKRTELQQLMAKNAVEVNATPGENSELMAAFDRKIAAMGASRGMQVAEKLSLFLAKIKVRSTHFAHSHS